MSADTEQITKTRSIDDLEEDTKAAANFIAPQNIHPHWSAIALAIPGKVFDRILGSRSLRPWNLL